MMYVSTYTHMHVCTYSMYVCMHVHTYCMYVHAYSTCLKLFLRRTLPMFWDVGGSGTYYGTTYSILKKTVYNHKQTPE